MLSVHRPCWSRADHTVTLFKQQFGEIGTVLTPQINAVFMRRKHFRPSGRL